ncbi:gamma-butyrobetaine hydroxylase-like domain-containing protein [Pseudoalteromonas denitrificans]|uniref:DUF971 family protein n=1 Tax=Pseudoalteromonas denitrificans DSM 6059 TaxID=1123010 RepID=A0A1I1PFE7_9GAMM|nr:gamma-butyrobetaine hydroxylase-like domain-containing protein [Pseudoalteromonas denitrificans]SFD08402.1 DUF971 family protein [Pseudoalteromonas denitrificans DSM 6059]
MSALVTKLHYHKKSKILDVYFEVTSDTINVCNLSAEYLRTHSPSAEVQGHGAKEIKLVANKKQVEINSIEPIGHYAVKLVFDDGHDSGIYSWQYLEYLNLNQNKLWQTYLQRLTRHNASREQIIPIRIQ